MSNDRLVFHHLSGVDQLHIPDATVLARIAEVDEARWVATSAPTSAFALDAALLGYLDEDGNGRIRVEELKAAVTWLLDRLGDRSGVDAASDKLPLSALDAGKAGAPLVELAKRLADGGAVSLAAVRAARSTYAASFPNGDGVVPAGMAGDDGVAALIGEIVRWTEGTAELGGGTGVSGANIDAWQERSAAWLAWTEREQSERDALFPLGDDTAAATDLLETLAPKVEQFFAQCALVALEPGASDRLKSTPAQLEALDVADPKAIDAWMASASLARPNAEGELPLTGAINPRFAEALHTLSASLAPKLLATDGPVESLSQAAWLKLRATVAAFQSWRGARPAAPADADADAVRGMRASPAIEPLRARIAADLAAAPELAAFNDLEKLLLLQAHALELANNFVSFPYLFDPGQRTLFEAGTFVLDGRKLTLCMDVADRAAHRKLAEKSMIFLLYADLERKEDGAVKKRSVVAGVTAGTQGGILAGKRGVFYDRDGAEWDALVTDVVPNPISVLEGMFAPFLRLRDMISDRVGKFIGSKADALEKDAATKTVAAPAAAATAPAAGPGAGMSGLLLGGSVAFAALGSTLAFVLKTVSSLDPKGALAGIATVALLLAAVSGLIAWLKLRKRDVSTLLEAGGWALNGRMRLSGDLAGVFTRRPALPDGSRRVVPIRWRRVFAWVFVLSALVAGAAWLALHPEVFEKPAAAEAPPAP